MNYEYSYCIGFLKRASEHNVPEETSFELLKQAFPVGVLEQLAKQNASPLLRDLGGSLGGKAIPSVMGPASPAFNIARTSAAAGSLSGLGSMAGAYLGGGSPISALNSGLEATGRGLENTINPTPNYLGQRTQIPQPRATPNMQLR